MRSFFAVISSFFKNSTQTSTSRHMRAAALIAVPVIALAATENLRATPEPPAIDHRAPLPASVEAEAPSSETKIETKSEAKTEAKTDAPKQATPTEHDACLETLKNVVRPANRERLGEFCTRVQRLPVCESTEHRPIQHADSGSDDARGKRILVFGMIHGDEKLAGEMALEWEERLQKIDHRNYWRVVPMLNPDGLRRMTRMNANGVDLNRNFPTKDWENEALAYWKKSGKKDPRRFPGDVPASESETKCALEHIKDFKPDFIVSVHTPYHVLDFDGPKMSFPSYKDLPWRALGTFPGSLGRYMWKDFSVPVLTVELGNSMVDAAKLQDIVGTFAIEASRRSTAQKTAKNE